MHNPSNPASSSNKTTITNRVKSSLLISETQDFLIADRRDSRGLATIHILISMITQKKRCSITIHVVFVVLFVYEI